MPKKKRIIIFAAASALTITLCMVSSVLLSTGQGRMYGDHLAMTQQYLDDIEYAQAVAELQKAIEIDPKQAEAYIMLADVYKDLWDYESSVSVLNAGLKAVEGEEAYEKLLERKQRIIEYAEIVSSKDGDLRIPSAGLIDEGVQTEECDHSKWQIYGEYRVEMSNPDEFWECSLMYEGFLTFQDDLSEYIDERVPGDNCFEVRYVSGSDESSSACTEFLIEVPELEITIHSRYDNEEHSFSFSSPLDEE